MDEKISKYYIGLDIGTDSVGWAVTDTNYNLIKKHGRDYWGSYIFKEANTAEERRQHRTARRRYVRIRQRIVLLQELFAEEISKVDPLFFIRLNNSKLLREDKDDKLQSKNAIFDDSNFNDKDFYKKYPTIFHLRSALINGEVTDIRLVYLALHHIIKNRGHFLFENQNFDVKNLDVIKGKFGEINEFLSSQNAPELDIKEIENILELLKNKRIGKIEKRKQLAKLMLVETKNKQLMSIIKLMVGSDNVKLEEIYNLEGSEITVSFDSDKYESILPDIENEVGDDIQLINDIKAIYDWSVLCDILGEEEYISNAKVKAFDKHRSDLKLLKEFVAKHCPQLKEKIFRRQDKLNNYAAYVGKDKNRGFKKCKSKIDFYNFLKSELKQYLNESDTDGQYILSEIESGSFLPKLRTNLNGIIPSQLHEKELNKILEQASKKYTFLNGVQGNLTVSEKIKLIFKFKIPYYVGPLNAASKHAWVVKNEGQEHTKITPWNFDLVIDKDESEKNFIRNMTKKCTRLVGEDVLPASSLLYSEFTFLNELNNLKVNGQKDRRVRELIFEYAKTCKKVTLKGCLQLLKSKGIVENSATENIFSGTDGDFTTSLSVYKDFAFLGERVETHSEMCEDIILMITLLSDKDRLERKIRQKYSKLLSDDEIKKLKGFNYTKWGTLSRKLLTEITSPNLTDNDGVQLSIIDAMRTTGENFSEVIDSNKYGFNKIIEKYNSELLPSNEITYDTIKDLYCSPSVKRSIWRTLDIVKEITKVMGCKPTKVFVETAREVKDDKRKGKRTISRKEQLLSLYENITTESKQWKDEWKNSISKQPDSKFNSDKLVLYYRQLGKDMYTGKDIPLDQVFNTTVCDKDHIYPQSKIKDDSLDNLVLVYKSVNATKTDIYPLDASIRRDRMAFWTELRQKGLISEKKFERLIRSTPLSQDELSSFIDRQLVFTRQSTKLVASILKRMFNPDTNVEDVEIVYSKAGNADAFKQKFDIIKVRDLNNLHHAKDAYINIVVGNIYSEKFQHSASVYFKNNNMQSYNLNKIYEEAIEGTWDKSWIGRVKTNVEKDTCQVVQMTTKGKGALFEATIVPAGRNENLIPLKENGKLSNTSKYGGYDSARISHFILVKSTNEKGNFTVSLESYPIWHELRSKGDKQAKIDYLTEYAKLIEPQILINEVKIKSLIKVDGSYAYICGKSEDAIVLANANELHLDQEYVIIVKRICKYIEARKNTKNPNLEVNENITAETNLMLYDELLNKLDSKLYAGLSMTNQIPLLKSKRDVFINLTLGEQCCVLYEILKLLQCDQTLSNFSALGGGKFCGKNRISKNNLQDKDIKFIYQSPTGYYRKVIDLKDLL